MFYNKSLICLLIFNCWTCAWTSITIFDDKNNSIANIDSLSAAFGPSISDDGLEGYIIVAKPLMGCTKLEPPPNVTLPGARSWIALIQRTPSRSINNCTFDLKVYNAQRAGYSAAIIFDYDSDILIRMSSNNVYNVRIPSVFIGHSKGVEISQKYTYENKTYAILYSDDADINYLLIPFVSVVSICFLIAICVFLTKLVIHCQKVRKNRFPKSELKKIPTKKYQKTDKYDTCPICLNEYEEGVKIRILPCEHAYHVECIDKWLLRNNRLCPVCKRRVIPGGSDSDSEDNETSTSSSNQPLLGTTSSGIGGQNRRVSDEHEPNEEDDTNETSRLLVRNNSNNNPQQSEDTSSVLTTSNLLACGSNNLLTTSSSHLNTAANGDIGSMNNQMMTTSISNTSQMAVRLTSNLTTTSKYGSITSINQTDETNQPTTARANLNFHDDNDEEIGYQYDNDGDDDDEQNYQSSKPTSSTRAKNINALKLTAVIDSKQTPEYYTPYETHQRPNKSPSSSSNHSSRSHSLTTQTTTATTTDECQKPKQKISKTKSKSKPTPAMKDFAQIAAQLEAENKKTTNVDATTTETATVTTASSPPSSSSSPPRPTINDEPNNVEFTEFQSAKEDDSDSLATPDTSNNSANQ